MTGGPAVALAEQVWEGGAEGAQYAVSSAGTMAYVASHPARYERRMVWVDRTGKVEPLTAMPRPYYDPRISPDGRRFAVSSEEASERVWTFDFARPILTALTGPGSSQAPAVDAGRHARHLPGHSNGLPKPLLEGRRRER